MGTIIPIDAKLKSARDKEDARIRKKKLVAARKMFRCPHCAATCDKCGIRISGENRPQVPSYRLPYTFCDSCAEEYVDYIDALKGRSNSAFYWHNDAWMKVWDTWIEHQGAVDGYLKSKEFERLLDELKSNQT